MKKALRESHSPGERRVPPSPDPIPYPRKAFPTGNGTKARGNEVRRPLHGAFPTQPMTFSWGMGLEEWGTSHSPRKATLSYGECAFMSSSPRIPHGECLPVERK